MPDRKNIKVSQKVFARLQHIKQSDEDIKTYNQVIKTLLDIVEGKGQ